MQLANSCCNKCALAINMIQYHNATKLLSAGQLTGSYPDKGQLAWYNYNTEQLHTMPTL